MSNTYSHAQAVHLLNLPDAHGAPLVDFEFYPTLDLLYMRWHGHLTAEAVVRGAKAGVQLFGSRALPAHLLTNHLAVTGEWSEALPWLHYEWLPTAHARGVRRVAHLLAQNTASQLLNYPGGPEFIHAFTQEIRAQSFRHEAPAWQWLLHH